MRTWANKLGFELSQLGKYVIKTEKFSENYKTAEVKPRDGNALVREIAKDIKNMMDSKISAIKVRSSLSFSLFFLYVRNCFISDCRSCQSVA